VLGAYGAGLVVGSRTCILRCGNMAVEAALITFSVRRVAGRPIPNKKDTVPHRAAVTISCYVAAMPLPEPPALRHRWSLGGLDWSDSMDCWYGTAIGQCGPRTNRASHGLYVRGRSSGFSMRTSARRVRVRSFRLLCSLRDGVCYYRLRWDLTGDHDGEESV
jgi:hypothetical protein